MFKFNHLYIWFYNIYVLIQALILSMCSLRPIASFRWIIFYCWKYRRVYLVKKQLLLEYPYIRGHYNGILKWLEPHQESLNSLKFQSQTHYLLRFYLRRFDFFFMDYIFGVVGNSIMLAWNLVYFLLLNFMTI